MEGPGDVSMLCSQPSLSLTVRPEGTSEEVKPFEPPNKTLQSQVLDEVQHLWARGFRSIVRADRLIMQ